MLTSLLLFGTTPAWACDWVEDERAKCETEDERPLAIPGGEPPPPQTVVRQTQPASTSNADARPKRTARSELELRYGMQFLDNAPAYNGYARLNGRRDAYLGAEVRYMPANELMWTGRVGAGFDVFGKSPVDLTLGLWLGGAGSWDLDANRPVLRNAPAAGTEVALGARLGRLYGKYRWIGGLAALPANAILSENELTVGFNVVKGIDVYGQYLVIQPRSTNRRGAVGLGIQATL